MKPISRKTQQAIREQVDFIYGLTSGENGYTGSIKSIGSRVYEITREMLSRGVLIKTYAGNGKGKLYNYRWNEGAMAPTNEFYKNISKAIIKRERNRGERKRERAKDNQPVIIEEVKEVPNSLFEAIEGHERERALSLDVYTIQELWDELKRRGCYIEDGNLALKTVQIFE